MFTLINSLGISTANFTDFYFIFHEPFCILETGILHEPVCGVIGGGGEGRNAGDRGRGIQPCKLKCCYMKSPNETEIPVVLSCIFCFSKI